MSATTPTRPTHASPVVTSTPVAVVPDAPAGSIWVVRHEMLVHDDTAGVPEWRTVAKLRTRDPQKAAEAAAYTAQRIIALHPGTDPHTGTPGIPVSTRVTVTWLAE